MNASTLQRVSMIQQHIDPKQVKILEIGALDSPTFKAPEFRISYVDYASREELSKKSATNPRYAFERLVDVNYVVCGERYSDVIPEKFDLIVANHVIEHIPDVIGWLYDLGTLLRPDGMIFLSVPDRRYTFDIVRRESNFIDLIRPHITKQTRPDFLNILDHFWNHKSVQASDAWDGTHHAAVQRMRFSHTEAMAHTDKASKLPYADVHCHVFTASSFAELMEDLQKFGYIGFQDLAIGPVARGSNEFHVMLKHFNPAQCARVLTSNQLLTIGSSAS